MSKFTTPTCFQPIPTSNLEAFFRQHRQNEGKILQACPPAQGKYTRMLHNTRHNQLRTPRSKNCSRSFDTASEQLRNREFLPSSKFVMPSQYLSNPSQESIAWRYNLQRCLRFKENQCGNQKMAFLNAPTAVLLSRCYSRRKRRRLPQIAPGRTLFGRVLGIFWRASLLRGTNCNGHCLPFHVRAFGPWLGS